eukprot:scaffold190503_cov26-Tisochrysis_lutea.AAC.1
MSPALPGAGPGTNALSHRICRARGVEAQVNWGGIWQAAAARGTRGRREGSAGLDAPDEAVW